MTILNYMEGKIWNHTSMCLLLQKETTPEDREFLHRWVLGGGNEMGGPEKKVMKFGGYICLKSFNLKNMLIVLHI